MASVDEFEREQQIMLAIKTSGRVTVNELADRFGVSTVTVRKDLDLLESRNLLRRVRGGAVGAAASDEGSFEMRMRYSRRIKSDIAKAVAETVDDGDVIAVDSSTTTYYLLQELVTRRNLVVITNGLRHAMLLMEQSSAMVLMPGGVIRRSAASLVGPIGDVLAERGRISAGFFGVASVSPTLGLLDISAEETQTKKALASACDQVYALFDSSKFNSFGLHSFVAPQDITKLYTDDQAEDSTVADWSSRGVPVVRTGPSGVSTASVPEPAFP